MTKKPALDKKELSNFLGREFPQVFGNDTEIVIDHLGYGDVVTRLLTQDKHLRPGGTVSGPSLMMLVDSTAYISVLSMRGKVAMAVTSSLNINFLRKPPKGDVICEVRPLKPGRTLFIVEASLYSADDPDHKLLAHATITYALPLHE